MKNIKKRKKHKEYISRYITWQFSGENYIGSHATTVQMLDPFFWGKILIGSNGGNVVTNEKYEKKENIKDIEI